MSCTEIYTFKNNEAYAVSSVSNAFRSAMAVWQFLERAYLPPYEPEYIKKAAWYRPELSYGQIEEYNGFIPSRVTDPNNPDAAKEIWDLVDKPNVMLELRIALATTFDKVLVDKQHFPIVVNAFKFFPADTSLPEQARIIEEIAKNPEHTAIGWNQTNVNPSPWFTEENDHLIPYDYTKRHDHKWLHEIITLP